MRKRDLLLGIAAMAVSGAFAQTVIYTQDFENLEIGYDILEGGRILDESKQPITTGVFDSQNALVPGDASNLIPGNWIDTVNINWEHPATTTRPHEGEGSDYFMYLYNIAVSRTQEDVEGHEAEEGVSDPYPIDSWDIVSTDGRDGNPTKAFYMKNGLAGGATTWPSRSIANYERCLRMYFPKGSIQENTSYRLSFYVKAPAAAETQIFMVKGIDYNDITWQKVYPFGKTTQSWMGSQTVYNEDYTASVKDASLSEWTYASAMFFYTTDSVLQHQSWATNSSWWSNWGTDSERNGAAYIYNPNAHRVQLWMPSQRSEYYIDDIALTNSNIGAAEYYGAAIRLKFGYQTNAALLANADPFKAIELPEGSVKVYGDGEEVEIKSAELQSDGYMYVFINDDDESWDYIDEPITIDFENKIKDQFVYTGEMYPYMLDTTYAKTKEVLDFKGELVSASSRRFNAVSRNDVAPSLISVSPEAGSFNLTYDKFNKFTFEFTKSIDAGKIIISGPGIQDTELQLQAEGTKVFATIPAGLKDKLNGDYTLQFSGLRHGQGNAADIDPITYSYGETQPVNRIDYLKGKEDKTFDAIWGALGENILPAGWKANSSEGAQTGKDDATVSTAFRLFAPAKGSYSERVLYFGRRADENRAEEKDSLYYGTVEEYTVELNKGDYKLIVPVSYQNEQNSCLLYVDIKNVDTDASLIGGAKGLGIKGVYNKETKILDNAYPNTVTFSVADDATNVYILFTLGGEDKNGVVISPIFITNMFNSVGAATKAYTDELAAYKKIIDTNAPASGKYHDAEKADAFLAEYDKVKDFVGNQPSEYSAVANEMTPIRTAYEAAIASIDKYYKAIADAKQALTDQADLAALQTYQDLKALAEKYDAIASDDKVYTDLDTCTRDLDKLRNDLNSRVSVNDNYLAAKANAIQVKADNEACNRLECYISLASTLADTVNLDILSASNDDVVAATDNLNGAASALSARALINNQFLAAVDAANVAKSEAEGVPANGLDFADIVMTETQEYKDLVAFLETYGKLDVYDPATEVSAITNATAILNGASKNCSLDVVEANSIFFKNQANDLFALAQQFGLSEAGAQELQGRVEGVEGRDAQLISLLKKVVSAGLYAKLEGGVDLPTNNFSAFMVNSKFQTNATKDKHGNLIALNLDDPKIYGDLIGGWTVAAYKHGGDAATAAKNLCINGMYGSGGNMAESLDAPVDVYFGCDWNVDIEVSQVVTGLPQAKYQIGIGANASEAKLDKNHSLYARSLNGGSSIDELVGFNNGGAGGVRDANVFAEGVLSGDYLIGFHNVACNGWGDMSRWSLKVTGNDDDANYTMLKESAEQELDNEVTGFAKLLVNGIVKFFNLSGTQTQNPDGLFIEVDAEGNASLKFNK